MADPRPSLGGKVVRWVETMIVHGEGDLQGQPFILRPDQKLLIWQWFEHSDEIDRDTGVVLWQFERLYYEAPKGLGKTMLFAALLIEAFMGPSAEFSPGSPNIPVGANSEDQADDTIWGRVCQILEDKNCPLSQFVTVYDDRVVFADGRPGQMQRVPNNQRTVDGGLPTLYVADEVHDWVGAATVAHQKIENSTTKRTNGRVMSCSTPGAYAGEPSVGWHLHDLGEKIVAGHHDDPHFLYVSHAAKLDDYDLDNEEHLERALVCATPGISRRRIERLKRRYREIDRASFCRFHLGCWPEQTRGSWLEDRPQSWASCGDAEIEPDASWPMWMALDASLRRDSTAVITGWEMPDGRVLVRARIWDPSDLGGVVPLDEVAEHVRQTWNDCGLDADGLPRLRHVAYDPRLFETLANALSDEGVPMLEYPQSRERMIPACAHTYSMIVTSRVVHDGDQVLSRHVTGAQKRHSESGWTLTKKKAEDGGRHIDACIALVMLLYAIETVPIAETGPTPAFVFT